MVAVLFARRDSVYKSLGCDVWDIDRDARRWPGGCAVIAHPPCRTWGRLRALATPDADEHPLAIWALAQVRTWGGVLEHPAQSTLWGTYAVPKPGQHDALGWTLGIAQWWFGHRAEKLTWLYIVGCAPGDVPPIPFQLGQATHVITTSRRGGARPEVSKAEREDTPLALARWLLTVAATARRPGDA